MIDRLPPGATPSQSRLYTIDEVRSDHGDIAEHWQDSRMLSGTCAFCGNQTHFTARIARVIEQSGRDSSTGSWQYRYELEVAGTCDACHRINAALGTSAWTGTTHRAGTIYTGSDAVNLGEAMDILNWSPPPMRPVEVTFIPDGVAGFFKEAHDAFSISAYRAVVLLVRSVIEATARHHEITSGTLVQKINKLFDEGHIRKGTKDMAHALRILGNDMAHGEIDEVPTQEDADDALTIARFVLDDVYVADARRADMMERRKPQPDADAPALE